MRPLLGMLVGLLFAGSIAEGETPFTIADYDSSLVKFGVPFYARYPLSFYTGFAMRVEEPKRVHFRAGRGNQVRLTAILDEHTILTYLYSLQKRLRVYAQAVRSGMIQTRSAEQLSSFRRIVESPAYDILGTIEAYEAQRTSKAQFYQTSLDILSALNPHRVFRISLDLRSAFLHWKANVQEFAQQYEGDRTAIAGIREFIAAHPEEALVLSDDMLFGRVNAVYLTEKQREQLAEILALVLRHPDDETTFLRLALDYFQEVTEGKYDMQTVVDGEFVSAIQCERMNEKCLLSYPEFTAIYPNGSVVGSTKDLQGNTIHRIRNSALMTFLDRPYHDVDHIRNEGYYGWAPKMDYQSIGNGIHNPGVSHYLAGMRHLYEELDIPRGYRFLWVVSRGPVSHGCIRMSVGHLWEVRQIFPSSPVRLKEMLYFGNRSSDYDVFDIDGDGTPEVMGTRYYIAYSVRGLSGLSSRKGKSFSLSHISKAAFYEHLYGKKGQFNLKGGTYYFPNPYISYFRKTHAGDKQGRVISRRLQGIFMLYEQPYERDKVQIYRLPTKFQKQLRIRNNFKSPGKQMARIFGRITACGPFEGERSYCYENSFDQEFQALIGKL